MSDANQAAQVLREAAQLNRDDPLREGSLLNFPDYGQLVMTGDMHGHRRNFEKLQRYCRLEYSPGRHVMLHELIHEDVRELAGLDHSHELLLEAARWKVEFPDQVHFLQSNHELAQLTRQEITKLGRVVTEEFERSVKLHYGEGGQEVVDAMDDFIASLPLGGRTANRVFLSHSIPGPREMPLFQSDVFRRDYNQADMTERGSAYLLVWGRFHTEESISSFCDMVDCDFILAGHEPQEMGYTVAHDRMLILASDHNHGVFLPFDLGKPVTMEALAQNVRPFAAIA